MKILQSLLSKKTTYWMKVMSVGLVVGLSIQFVQAWTNPTLPAPNGNVAGPINVGIFNQIKNAGLGVQSLLVTGSARVFGKVFSSSTVSGDTGDTLATKDYVDNKTVNKRRVVFTSSQSWTVPDGVTSAEVTMAGGGGSGVGWRVGNMVYSGHSGGYVFSHPVTLVPGETIQVIVGRGGKGYGAVNSGVPADPGPPYYIYTNPPGDDGLGGYPGESSKLVSPSDGTLLECAGGSGAAIQGVDSYSKATKVAGNLDEALTGGGRPTFPSPNRKAAGSLAITNGPGTCGADQYGIGNFGSVQWGVGSGSYYGGSTPFGYGSGAKVYRSGCYVTSSLVGKCTVSDSGRDGVVMLDIMN